MFFKNWIHKLRLKHRERQEHEFEHSKIEKSSLREQLTLPNLVSIVSLSAISIANLSPLSQWRWNINLNFKLANGNPLCSLSLAICVCMSRVHILWICFEPPSDAYCVALLGRQCVQQGVKVLKHNFQLAVDVCNIIMQNRQYLIANEYFILNCCEI